MDAMDVAGENHLDIEHGMWKQRLAPDGSAIGEAFTEVVSFAAICAAVQQYIPQVRLQNGNSFTRWWGSPARQVRVSVKLGSVHTSAFVVAPVVDLSTFPLVDFPLCLFLSTARRGRWGPRP